MTIALIWLAACGILGGGDDGGGGIFGGGGASAEVCGNGLDDDANGLGDCADPVCAPQCGEVCGDGVDNDADALVDCLDPHCDGSCPENCGDGRDNDGDSAADCDDADCDGNCPEDCTDGRDNDGDDLVDCEDNQCDGSCPEDCFDGRDNDGDGDPDCDDDQCMTSCDFDGDGFVATELGGEDCDDDNGAISPVGQEVCNGVDDDCDHFVDDLDATLDTSTATQWYTDFDGDNFGGNPIGVTCIPPAGLVATVPGDCNDVNAAQHPEADEVCNGIDDDCNGASDDDDPTVDLSTGADWYSDLDHDGYGAAYLARSCSAPLFGVSTPGDCNDDDDDVHPARTEVCNDDIDDDCDTLVDDDDPSRDLATATTWYSDLDGDGFGVIFAGISCDAPANAADVAGDCVDSNPAIHPDAPEICNGDIDDDCDTLADDADPSMDPTVATAWYADADADGYGTGAIVDRSCLPVAGAADNDDDCDDSDDAIHPAATEVCGGEDDDCDTLVDEADPSLDPTSLLEFGVDSDGDGYGDPALFVEACTPPPGAADNVLDCDDSDPDILGLTDWVRDLDGDGFGAGAITASCTKPAGLGWVRLELGLDCDDADDEISPDGDDVCGDGIDQDCSGADEVCFGDLVGFYYVYDGPSWSSDPLTYSCVETCALLFGGSPTNFSCSVTPLADTSLAHLDGYGDETYCTLTNTDTYKKGATYDCGGAGCSYSAWVKDHVACDVRNYCWEL